MQDFINDFAHSFAQLGTTSGMLALANIIFIDIVMSGDNAILIGMATRKLQGKQRSRAILFGIALATVLRIIFAGFTVVLMGVVGLKLAGGILLLYVVWKFYKELRSDESGEHGSTKAAAGLLAAVWTIVVADVSMSLDNVLAVAGAAHGNMAAMAIGLVFSIILMAFASHAIAKMLDRYPAIQWLGLIVILFVAMEMVLAGSGEIEGKIVPFSVVPFVAFLVGGAFLVLQQKYVRPITRESVRKWISDRFASVLVASLVVLLVLVHFGDIVTGFFRSHPALLWSVSFGLFLAILEVVSVLKVREKKPLLGFLKRK